MSPRMAVGLAWLTLGACASVTAAAVAVWLATDTIAPAAVPGGTGIDLWSLALLAFPVVGALIVRRQPSNAIGWIMLADGVAAAIYIALQAYAGYALEVVPGTLPGADLALTLIAAMWVVFIGLPGTFLLLLFPDGRLPSPPWRRWAWLCAVALILPFIATVVRPGSLADQGHPEIVNPLGIDALEPAMVFLAPALIPVCVVGCAVALILRFRRSHGLARLQLKWLALGAGTTAGLYLLAVVPSVATGSSWGEGTPPWLTALQLLSIFSFVLIPLAIAIAILRHQLYDVDVVINRALVYGALTALLGGAYVGLVLLLQLALAPVTESSSLAVAGSTLAVAALFRPVRARVQAVVDRRFYRRRYDAQRTVERFGARLRDEVELDSIGVELRAAVGETVQPSHVSLWLRGGERG